MTATDGGEEIIRTRWDEPAAVWVAHVDYHGVKIYSQGATEPRAREALVSALVLTIATWQTKYPDALATARAEGIAEGATAERERCAKAMCPRCREGLPLRDDGWHVGTHPAVHGYALLVCLAAAILDERGRG